MKKIFSLLLFFCLCSTITIAQISEDQARKELEERGIGDDEIRKKLEEKGIDIDNIDPSNIGQVEEALKEAVEELEEEKRLEAEAEAKKAAQEAVEEVAKEAAEEIQEAIEDGTSIEEAVSEELIDAQEELPKSRVYGQHIFRNKSIKLYTKSEDVKALDTYILGAGDVVTISIWGSRSQESATYTIDNGGYIKPSQMPRIYLKGIALGKARKLLQSHFGEFYSFRKEDFEVSLNYARTISVNIVGEVMNYGSFNIPATNTAFNALVAAGGPSDIGSVRNIKLVRPGEQAKRIDIYEFMTNPSVEESLYLKDNDYIHVPVVDRLVSVTGAVKRPFVYELIRGENLKKLVEYAGGFKDNAYQSNIQVKRFADDREVIQDVNFRDLMKSGRDFELFAGDEVIVNIIPKPYKNFATIEGAVDLEGKYEISSGMRVSQLIKKGVLTEDARTDIAFIQRSNPDGTIKYIKVNIAEVLQNPSASDNIELAPKDKLIIYSQAAFVDKSSIYVDGAVRQPSEHPFDPSENLKISDAVILAGGLRPDATSFAYIHRKDPKLKKQKEYIRVELDKAVDSPNSIDNIALKPFDTLFVYSNITYTDETSVRVTGAVRQPGEYGYDESLDLRDVLTLAGGLKLEAASNRIDIFRVVLTNDEPTQTIVATLEVNEDLMSEGGGFKLFPFDHIVVREVPDFEFQQTIILKGEIKYPGPYALINKNERISSVIGRAGGITEEAFEGGATLYRSDEGVGYVVMDLEDALDKSDSRHNYILKDGDVIEIPKKKDLVTIRGATRASDLYPDKVLLAGNKITVAYHEGKTAKFYIDEYAAGVGNKGRRRLISVEHPNGQIERTKNYVLFRKYPEVRKGSIITVGAKPKQIKTEGEKENDVDWGKVLADSIAQATAVLSLILLIQRVN